MPLYDYQCQNCNAVFEVRATFKEKEQGLKPPCPQCQSKQTRQLLTSGLLLRVVNDNTPQGGCACGSGGGLGCCG
jgi:putative FmdB family regulatory protein